MRTSISSAEPIALKLLRTRLGRLIRDISRKVAGDPGLSGRFAPLRALAVKIRFQNQHQRGPKIYSLHAPEVECIAKGKARAPYEFGCKVSIATPVGKPKSGQFVLQVKALHGNPFNGTPLKPAVADLEKNTGVKVRLFPSPPHSSKRRILRAPDYASSS